MRAAKSKLRTQVMKTSQLDKTCEETEKSDQGGQRYGFIHIFNSVKFEKVCLYRL
jgi:hypothetical protein